jgi:hypothetical protein
VYFHRPPVLLDLFYLIGVHSKFRSDAERLLGWLMLRLNEATHLIYRPRRFLLPDGREVDSASEDWRHESEARAICSLPSTLVTPGTARNPSPLGWGMKYRRTPVAVQMKRGLSGLASKGARLVQNGCGLTVAARVIGLNCSAARKIPRMGDAIEGGWHAILVAQQAQQSATRRLSALPDALELGWAVTSSKMSVQQDAADSATQ